MSREVTSCPESWCAHVLTSAGARTRKKIVVIHLEPVTCPAHSRARKPRVRLASSRRCLSRASLKPRPSPQARRRARAASARRPRAPSRPRAVRVPSFSAPGHLFREPSRIPRRARRGALLRRGRFRRLQRVRTLDRARPPRPRRGVGRARLGGRVRRARRNLRLRRGPHRRPHLGALLGRDQPHLRGAVQQPRGRARGVRGAVAARGQGPAETQAKRSGRGVLRARLLRARPVPDFARAATSPGPFACPTWGGPPA